MDSGTGNVTAGTKERDFVTIGISIVVRCISRKSVYKVCTKCVLFIKKKKGRCNLKSALQLYILECIFTINNFKYLPKIIMENISSRESIYAIAF